METKKIFNLIILDASRSMESIYAQALSGVNETLASIRMAQEEHPELLNIYRQLRPNTDEARLNLTITKVVNPLGNALNENFARIRKAFVEKFDEHLAKNYIITRERSSTYSIPFDRNLITWEES